MYLPSMKKRTEQKRQPTHRVKSLKEAERKLSENKQKKTILNEQKE
jgi:hypothetical protein